MHQKQNTTKYDDIGDPL